MVLLSCVVFSVWQKGEKTGSLDGVDDAGLLLARRPRATGGFDFTGGRQKFRQHIEAFIVDFFKLELGYDLSAVALKSIDGDLLLFNVCTAVGQKWEERITLCPIWTAKRRKKDRCLVVGCQYAHLKPSLSTSTRACFGIFLALGVGGLILAHPGLYPRETAYLLLSAATALAWVAVVARKWRTREQFIPPRILVGTAALWGTGAILSVSLNSDASWNPLLFLGSQLLFLWIGWWLAADRNALKMLAVSFLAGAALSGLWAILQHYYQDPFLHSTQPEGRIVSVFANPNYFGNYMAAAMPLALALFMQSGDRRLQVASCLLTGLVYAGLLLTASRGAWFASPRWLPGSVLRFYPHIHQEREASTDLFPLGPFPPAVRYHLPPDSKTISPSRRIWSCFHSRALFQHEKPVWQLGTIFDD